MKKNKLLPIERNREMKAKESYTLEELCNSLSITLTKFCQMADITEGTLIRLRQGHAARRVTINKILETFSKVYGLEFSLDNVSGLIPQEQASHQRKSKAASTLPIVDKSQDVEPQNRIVEPKREYKLRKTDLPEGCILAIDFARNHGITRETMRWHMDNGLGPGLIGMSTDTIPERDRIKYSQRIKRLRKDGIEYERYLTPEQQEQALQFWDRHSVVYKKENN